MSVTEMVLCTVRAEGQPSILPTKAGNILTIPPDFIRTAVGSMLVEANYHLDPAVFEMWNSLLADPETSPMERWVIGEMMTNAVVSAGTFGLPICQDTGQALVMVDRGEMVVVTGDLRDAVNAGTVDAYTNTAACLRKSMTANQALSGGERGNTRNNSPATLYESTLGWDQRNTMVISAGPKGGGSISKTRYISGTAATNVLEAVTREIVETIGTGACPPYSLSVAVGGDSAQAMMTSLRYAYDLRDELPATAEAKDFGRRLLANLQKCGLGAQFGGKHLAWRVGIPEIPSHIASRPIAITVLCGAPRRHRMEISPAGVYKLDLVHDPEKYLPSAEELAGVKISQHLELPIVSRDELQSLHAGDVVSLSGEMFIARDIAHKRMAETLQGGQKLPIDLSGSAFFIAGPSETPAGRPIGSCGPTTAERCDPFTPLMLENGVAIQVGKGSRSTAVRQALKEHGGVYLAVIGGAAALAAQRIKFAEIVDYADLGAEALRRIQVEGFTAVVINDAHGNDFYEILKEQSKVK